MGRGRWWGDGGKEGGCWDGDWDGGGDGVVKLDTDYRYGLREEKVGGKEGGRRPRGGYMFVGWMVEGRVHTCYIGNILRMTWRGGFLRSAGRW